MLDLGSPPLARGTDAKTRLRTVDIRITPACAGNSLVVWSFSASSWDHPRLRGEQLNPAWVEWLMGGSPPLARGTAIVADTSLSHSGITPACAGNSALDGILCAFDWDHPRLRGEQFVLMLHYRPGSGSPPLARGTDAIDLIISTALGSPPLARGTGIRGPRKARGGGITPACAGNRLNIGPRPRTYKDHPRLRGEQVKCLGACGLNLGSPPLARGTDNFDTECLHRVRITPACAGNS